jgi:predicted nucleic acid-binding Zn ribbon protein
MPNPSRWRSPMVLMTQHTHCNACGEPMPKARFGQRYCSQGCRAAGNAEAERVARRLWREAGRPKLARSISSFSLGQELCGRLGDEIDQAAW